MEPVSLITTADTDDLIVAFAIEDSEPGEVKSLILLRTPKYEFVFDDRERGVSVSHDDYPETELDDDLLVRIGIAQNVVAIDSQHHRYELDVSRVDREQLAEAWGILRRMNFDNRFTLEIF
jgi:hypothetical protein